MNETIVLINETKAIKQRRNQIIDLPTNLNALTHDINYLMKFSI